MGFFSKRRSIVAAIDDLTTAVAAMTDAVGKAANEMKSLADAITKPGVSEAQLEAIASQIKTQADALTAATDAAATVIPSPPATLAALQPAPPTQP